MECGGQLYILSDSMKPLTPSAITATPYSRETRTEMDEELSAKVGGILLLGEMSISLLSIKRARTKRTIAYSNVITKPYNKVLHEMRVANAMLIRMAPIHANAVAVFAHMV
mmetsp:Transcript_60584/g.71956  ORF Transcript_60584/g.71956 Transcript_60584/m.71956 type:complete len:111 (-) Transcript_60584:234-566(-)